MNVTGGNQRTLKERLGKYDISIEHFKKERWNWDRSRKELEDILVKDSTYLSTNTLKKRLLKADLLEEKCAECGIPPEWNGKPLTLELDHIDGDNRNNELSNLRLLCPNCHSQTETFGGKNQVREKKIHKCMECDVVVSKGAKTCRSCSSKKTRKKSRKVEWPTPEELEDLLRSHSMVQIGKKYGVSDNAVRKWCKYYEIDLKRKHPNK